MAVYTVTIVCILLYVIVAWLKKKHRFWEEKGIKSDNPQHIVGNFGKVFLLKQSNDSLMSELYKKYPEEKYVGVYMGYKPGILLRDTDLIKQVLIKDFQLFQDRGVKPSDEKRDENVFFAEGETWRILRQKLTPIFSSGKLKSMMPLIHKSADEYIDYVERIIKTDSEHEIRDLASKYTLNVIGSCAFGVDMDAFNDKPNVFCKVAHDIFNPSTFVRLVQIVSTLMPGITKFLKKIVGKPKHTTKLGDFFLGLVRNIVKEREGKPKVRMDFMDLMIDLKEQGVVKRREENNTVQLEMDDELIAAQAIVFYAAGFETSSATMSFMLHELAYNQDVQDKLYNEIVTVTQNHGGLISYEAIKEMNYLSMCFDETLRKYAVAGTLMRKSLTNYKFSDDQLTIPKGTSIFISVSGLHHDEKYYPDPEVFDPERFSPENKGRNPVCAYLAFGEGPRNCIGLRFAKVQSSVGIAAFLKNFKVEPSSTSNEKLVYNPSSVTLTSKSGICLKISKR